MKINKCMRADTFYSLQRQTNLSEMFDLTYGNVRIIQDMMWSTQYIMLYTLVKAEKSELYPKFVTEEYLNLCLITVNEFINRYLSEKDSYKKEEIGNFILAFPAIEKYQKLAVEQFPAEAPDELITRVKRFIVCPCKLKMLSEYFVPSSQSNTAENAKPLAFLTENSLDDMFKSAEVNAFINRIPFLHKKTYEDEPKEQYKQFFRDFGISTLQH